MTPEGEATSGHPSRAALEGKGTLSLGVRKQSLEGSGGGLRAFLTPLPAPSHCLNAAGGKGARQGPWPREPLCVLRLNFPVTNAIWKQINPINTFAHCLLFSHCPGCTDADTGQYLPQHTAIDMLPKKSNSLRPLPLARLGIHAQGL